MPHGRPESVDAEQHVLLLLISQVSCRISLKDIRGDISHVCKCFETDSIAEGSASWPVKYIDMSKSDLRILMWTSSAQRHRSWTLEPLYVDVPFFFGDKTEMKKEMLTYGL